MGIESSIDQSLDHEERAVVALEEIAGAFTVLAKLASQWYDKLYPVKVPRDATVTKIPNDDDLLRESLGGDGSETLEEWSDLGPRERSLAEKKRG